MRYRKLSPDGDYSFGQGEANFYIDLPQTVGQSVLTRLRLLTGEWFLDVTEGTPYSTEILGEHTKALYDTAIRTRVLDTEGVTDIAAYSSDLNGETRHLTVEMTINTRYGMAPPIKVSF